eukprot:gnl/MRDRNA2_/MRDRNA2_81578_c0_seq1.p1 gnl/MRDRNA2_/MRDRNA2_81578_c0~~gnl/MRDRNA2_/MRDRNA2_81578_c0_seq1.p1  ORF type:complete len:128 (+),score=12.42 gnl/MRDRNA2_/MRDRNA2_81578_c0_seq1:95-478(+)
MTFGSYGRWARCRGVGAWTRRFNAQYQLRGLSASPLLRACTELVPPVGFAEQRQSGICSAAMANLSDGGIYVASDGDEALAELLDDLILGTTVSLNQTVFSEILNLSGGWICTVYKQGPTERSSAIP